MAKKDLKTLQKEEALKRLQLLKLHPNVVKDFENGKIYYSMRQNKIFDGILYWVDGDQKIFDAIKTFEKQTGAFVYHAQLTRFEFGLCLTMLFVSKYKQDWKYDIQDIENKDENGVMSVYAYAYNMDVPEFSDLGLVGIKRKNGGIARVY